MCGNHAAISMETQRGSCFCREGCIRPLFFCPIGEDKGGWQFIITPRSAKVIWNPWQLPTQPRTTFQQLIMEKHCNFGRGGEEHDFGGKSEMEANRSTGYHKANPASKRREANSPRELNLWGDKKSDCCLRYYDEGKMSHRERFSASSIFFKNILHCYQVHSF